MRERCDALRNLAIIADFLLCVGAYARVRRTAAVRLALPKGLR